MYSVNCVSFIQRLFSDCRSVRDLFYSRCIFPMKCLGVWMCLLTVSVTRSWPKMPKSFHFPKHGHIRDSQYPFESGGGWGLFVFHKYFLVLIEHMGFKFSFERVYIWFTHNCQSINQWFISYFSIHLQLCNELFNKLITETWKGAEPKNINSYF